MKKTKSLAERITELKPEIEAELDRQAERLRPKGPSGVPAEALRAMWMAKAGNNIFEAFLLASKEATDGPLLDGPR